MKEMLQILTTEELFLQDAWLAEDCFSLLSNCENICHTFLKAKVMPQFV